MGNATNLAGVRRFGDELGLTACDHEGGATVYLSLSQAKAIRAAMGRIIRSIEREGFGDARPGLTCNLTVRDRRYTHGPRIER
jgi:hypothetical protein